MLYNECLPEDWIISEGPRLCKCISPLVQVFKFKCKMRWRTYPLGLLSLALQFHETLFEHTFQHVSHLLIRFISELFFPLVDITFGLVEMINILLYTQLVLKHMSRRILELPVRMKALSHNWSPFYFRCCLRIHRLEHFVVSFLRTLMCCNLSTSFWCLSFLVDWIGGLSTICWLLTAWFHSLSFDFNVIWC